MLSSPCPPRGVVILDRDGTLIDVVRDEETGTVLTAFHPKHVRLLPSVIQGLTMLIDAGYALAIATNQPGPAKGHFSPQAVHQTNQELVNQLAGYGVPIAAVEACMHHPEGAAGGDLSLLGACPCRKPMPGMLLRILSRLGADAAQSWMVGDSTSDIKAGTAAGVSTALLLNPDRCELCPLRKATDSTIAPTITAKNVADLAVQIVALRDFVVSDN